jgi:hypothetical protein
MLRRLRRRTRVESDTFTVLDTSVQGRSAGKLISPPDPAAIETHTQFTGNAKRSCKPGAPSADSPESSTDRRSESA